MTNETHYAENIVDNYPQYLNDESNIVTNGYASRLYFPTSEEQIAAIIKVAREKKIPVTISGGGTGLSAGRVPLDGWLIATDNMQSITRKGSEQWTDNDSGIRYELLLQEIDDFNTYLTIPVSMTLQAVQNYLRPKNWFYPPDPTERSAFIGGIVSTNASGARSFKYSASRKWIQAIRVVLPDGEIVDLDRNRDNGSITPSEIIIKFQDREIKIPRPSYTLPDVSKHVAGPVLTDTSHPIDIFIGSNGIFGVITEVTLRLVPSPSNILSIFVYCNTMDQAFSLIRSCQDLRKLLTFPTPMSVEFLDAQAVDIMREKDKRIKDDTSAIVMLEQDVFSEQALEDALEFWMNEFDILGIEDSDVAQTHKEVEHHKSLRHHVPEYVLALNRSYGQSLVISDTSVPEENFKEFFDYLIAKGKEFADYQNSIEKLDPGNPGFTLFGHAGDCHVHLTLLPRNKEESGKARDIYLQVLRKTVDLGGSIASEHGLGKKMFDDRPALMLQYGEAGYNQVKKMKKALDPDMLLCRGNLISD